jgi:uncharacterized protein (TIRG00374 family)
LLSSKIEKNLKVIKWLISFVFMAFFVVWLSRCDFSAIYDNASNIKPEYILIAAAGYVLRYGFYARKFQLVFPPLAGFRFKDFLFLAFSASYCNFIVPSAGLFITIWVLKHRGNISAAYSTLAIITERVGSQALALVILSTALMFVESSPVVRNATFFCYVLGGGFVILGAFIGYHRSKILPLLGRLTALLPAYASQRVRFDGASINRLGALFWSWKFIALFFVLTLLQFASDGIKLYYLLAFTGYNLSFVSCLVAYTIIGFMLAVPVLPGSIGAYEFICISVLHYMFSVPMEITILITVLDRVLSVCLLWTLGTISLASLNVCRQTALAEAETERDGVRRQR